jgi:hypothetical protein
MKTEVHRDENLVGAVNLENFINLKFLLWLEIPHD